MAKICEHDFVRRDDKNPAFSDTEFDLVAATGLSIRKNFELNVYEIFEIKTGEAAYRYPVLADVVRCANALEHGAVPAAGEWIVIRCNSSCPRAA